MSTLYWDIETTGVDGTKDRPLMVGWAVDDGAVGVWVPGNRSSFEDPTPYLADPGVVKVSHTTFDPRFMREQGWTVEGEFHDTRVMAYVLNENTPLDLEWIAWHYSQEEMDKRLKRHKGGMAFVDDEGGLHPLEDMTPDHPAWAGFRAYCVRDVDTLRVVYKDLRLRMSELEWERYWETEEVPYTGVLLDMEGRGLPVDLDRTAELSATLEVDATRLHDELIEEAGLPSSFNLNRPPQLVAYLFSRVVTLNDTLVLGVDEVACIKSCLDGEHEDCECEKGCEGDCGNDEDDGWHCADFLPEGFQLDKLGRDRVHGHWTVKGRGLKATPPTVDKVTGKKGKLPSTSSPELLYMHAADPWVRKLCLEYRKTEKLLTTYTRKFPLIAREGRIYGRYNQAGTVTGRLSSSGPNMQNMPSRGLRGKQVRSLFVGNLIIGDYDQLEMRLMAHLSGDPRLTEVFRTGQDPHYLTAQGIFGQSIDPHGEEREQGKLLNYTMAYGAGPRKVAQTLSLVGYPTSPDVARGYLAEMERFYRTLFQWKKVVIADAKRRGFVTTMGGRRRRLRATFKDVADWKLVGYGERQAVNAEVQGTAADVLRRAMVRLDREVGGMYPLLAQVHDELVMEYANGEPPSPTTLRLIQDIAETGHGFKLDVPLAFEPTVCASWAEKGGKAGYDWEELAHVGT